MSTLALPNASAGQPGAKLTPKERGAYAVLGVPIVTALIVAGPTVVGVCDGGTRRDRGSETAVEKVHWLAIVSLSLLVAALTSTELTLPITALPMLAMSCYLMVDPPPARHLKRVGWALVGEPSLRPAG